MIKSIKVSKLRNNEFLQFNTNVVKRCEHYDLTSLKLNEAVTQVKTNTAQLEQVYNKDTRSEITEKMITSDGMRDDDLVGIRTVCEGYTYSRDKVIADAANLILNSIDRHGKSLSRLNYQAQTTVVDAIVKDWTNQVHLKNALEVISLTSWAQSLKEENNSFSNLYQLRVDDKLDTVGDSFTDLRVNVVSAYRTLCDTIFAHSVISKNELYSELANAINLIIDDYQSIIDRREATKDEKVELQL